MPGRYGTSLNWHAVPPHATCGVHQTNPPNPNWLRRLHNEAKTNKLTTQPAAHACRHRPALLYAGGYSLTSERAVINENTISSRPAMELAGFCRRLAACRVTRGSELARSPTLGKLLGRSTRLALSQAVVLNFSLTKAAQPIQRYVRASTREATSVHFTVLT